MTTTQIVISGGLAAVVAFYWLLFKYGVADYPYPEKDS